MQNPNVAVLFRHPGYKKSIMVVDKLSSKCVNNNKFGVYTKRALWLLIGLTFIKMCEEQQLWIIYKKSIMAVVRVDFNQNVRTTTNAETIQKEHHTTINCKIIDLKITDIKPLLVAPQIDILLGPPSIGLMQII